MRVHSHDDTILIIGGHNVADELAEAGITAKPMGDTVTPKSGMGGAMTYAVNKIRNYTVEVNFLQGAEANTTLRAYHEAFLQTGAEFPMEFTTGSGEVLSSAFACVTKEPDLDSANEAGERQWIITARKCVVVDNPDALSIETLIPSTGQLLSFL